MKKLFLLLAILIVLLAAVQTYNLIPNINFTDVFKSPVNKAQPDSQKIEGKRIVVYEESVITKVVDEALPSVVTIGISKNTSSNNTFRFNPFDPFSPFSQIPGGKTKIEQNIGSGFIAVKDGLIITNKHVVSDTDATYQVLTNDNKKYNVDKIYRDPLNDLAILKINASGLKPLKLGNSTHLKLGQIAIAIGTPLGEFRNTVTAGIVSGLGRGITAGSPYEGYVEKLDNVIQTDAPISPGNSGGPLLNSSGEVIGINTAIAQDGQNIGFAIPVNVVKELMDNFNKRGQNFERPFLGVRYKMIDKQNALMNDAVEGAYIVQVVSDSPAEKAGVQEEDIIIEMDGKKVRGEDDQSLVRMTLEKRIGDKVKIKVWRNGQVLDKTLALEALK